MELDDEMKKDLMDAFLDLQHEAEACIATLTYQWDMEVMHSLFRVIHNVKGNAGIMGVSRIVAFTHEIEEVVGAFRVGKFEFTPDLSECLLIGLDRLYDLHQQELYQKHFDHLRIDELQHLYGELSRASGEQVNDIAQKILHIPGVIDQVEDHSSTASVGDEERMPGSGALESTNQEEKLHQDLIFFQELALQIDNQLPGWEGRSIQLFEWAMKMNQLAGAPIDSLQFTAAIYLHDFGMTLMPHELWDKKLDLNPAQCESLVHHPGWGYNYLIRVPGWDEAAQIVHQHHECLDGSGYPAGLKGDQIHPGAKILAILDTFFFLTKGRVDVSERRSTVRAVSAINARVDTDFEGMWVQIFNHMIRKQLKDGYL